MKRKGFGPQFVESSNRCRGLWLDEYFERPNKVEDGKACNQSPNRKILSMRLAALPRDHVNFLPFKVSSIRSQQSMQFLNLVMEDVICEPPFLSDGNKVSLKSPARHHGLLTLSLNVTRYFHSSFFRFPTFKAYTKETRQSRLDRVKVPSTCKIRPFIATEQLETLM
jgi:hypothetical protein